MIYATEKSLKDYGDKVSQAERADIEAKTNDLKSAVKDKNIERIKKGMEELTKVSHKLAEEIYKQAAAKQQKPQDGQAASGSQQDSAEEPENKAGAGGSAAGKDEDIIDAEYKEEDTNGKK